MATEKPAQWARLATDLPVLVLCGYASDALLGRDLNGADQATMLGALAAGLVVVRGISSRRLPMTWRSGWQNLLLTWSWLGLLEWLAGRILSQPVSLFHAVYLPGAALMLAAGLRALSRGRITVPGGEWKEDLRLVALAGIAVGIFAIYLTPLLVGGQDAHWYAYAMMDALEQARSGVFPVLVGQGEYMFNGAVLPIRIAPVHQYFGILLDGLTWRMLTPLAVQHLTVIGTAVLGTLSCYLCLTALVPARRWLAWGLALVYISSPLVAAYIYEQEMYMTFMAFAWLPLVVYGNVRVIRQDDRTGWVCVAAGLTLVWMCHAPVGAWMSLATFGVQSLRLLTRDFNGEAWRRALLGGLLFGGLSGYYFWSVTEIAPAVNSGAPNATANTVLLLLGAAALIRFVVTARWWWLLPVAVVAGMLWSIHQRAGVAWLGCALPGAVVAAWAGRRWAGVRGRWPELSVGVLLLGGVVATQFWPNLQSGFMADQIREGTASVTEIFFKALRPVAADATAMADVQLGYALWLLLLTGVVSAAFKQAWELRLLALIALLLVMLYAPVPKVTAFLFSVVPVAVWNVSGIGLWLRFLPVLATMGVFLGALGLADFIPGRKLARAMFVAGAGLILLWCGSQVFPFIFRGFRGVASREKTASIYRTENAQLHFYSYFGIPVPAHYIHGVVDARLQSRLLRAEDLVPIADPLFSRPPEAELTFTTAPDEFAAYWLHLRPKLTLQPGERMLLEFSFFDKTYAGVLRFQGSGGFYRDYFLPDAGPFGKGFGVAPGRGKTLSLWNSTGAPEEIEAHFILPAPPATSFNFGDFARVVMRKFKLADTQIQTLRLVPNYVAEVEVASPAFLETLRSFIPGYRATVNGQAVPVKASPDHLAMVPLRPGRNHIELIYRGTLMLRLMMGISAVAWLGLIAVVAWATWRARSPRLLPSATI